MIKINNHNNMTQNKPSRAIREPRVPNNIHETGTPIKRKERCYYCNEDCTNGFVKIHQGNKIRTVCNVCNRGTQYYDEW
jgi:hypothetical protein